MRVRLKLSEVPPGLCYADGPKGGTRKKLGDGRLVSIGKDRRVRYRKPTSSDPTVSIVPCPLRYLGVGLRNNPENVVEIGSSKPSRPRKRGSR